MGKIADTLIAQIQRQVGQHGLVVWLDPDRIYGTVADGLRDRGIALEQYEGSFFELRHRLEPALSRPEAPKLVVYVPFDEAVARGPLCELFAAGEVMKPGHQTTSKNTRLTVVARAALSEILQGDAIEPILRKVESGVIGLSDLEQIAQQGVAVITGSLALVYATTSPAQIALLFLTARSYDNALAAKAALPELASLLQKEYGVQSAAASTVEELRRAFSYHCFGVGIRGALTADFPKPLSMLPRAENKRASARCTELLREWRNRRDLRADYVEHADAFETTIGLDSIDFSAEHLERLEGYRCTEKAYQRSLEQRLLEGQTPAPLAQLALNRLDSFWSAVAPDIMDRWALIAAVGRLLDAAKRTESVLKNNTATVHALVLLYAGLGDSDGEPLCVLDTYHRQMERRFHHFDLDVTGRDQLMEQLVSLARSRYTDAASTLSERFFETLRAAAFSAGNVPMQRETFERFARPALDTGKVAYLLVDGLRYEMARELYLGIRDDYEAEISVTLGTLPSITEVGMAALVPGAHEPATLLASPGGKLALEVRGRVLKNRKDRMDQFERELGAKVHTTKLDALLPPNARVKEQVRRAQLVVVTATEEIDALCERNNVAMARRLMDDVLVQLRRALRVLFELGIQTILITADHGYLFGEALESGAKMDPPGGNTLDLHRRVWVGKGGASSDSYVRLTSREVGLGGDLEMAIPKSLGGFKVSTGSAYFHGGASPQELLIPVCVVRRSARPSEPTYEMEWRLTLGSKKISTLYLSVQVEGKAIGLFELVPPTLRIEVRDGREVISKAVAASYGFDDSTGFIRPEGAEDRRALRPNTVTLMLLERPEAKQVSVVLVDASTERVLAALEKIDVAIVAL